MRLRSEIRDIERHEAVRVRGSAASGGGRGLDARALRQLRGMGRTPQRYIVSSGLPLTHQGWMLVFLACGLVIALAAIIVLLHH